LAAGRSDFLASGDLERRFVFVALRIRAPTTFKSFGSLFFSRADRISKPDCADLVELQIVLARLDFFAIPILFLLFARLDLVLLHRPYFSQQLALLASSHRRRRSVNDLAKLFRPIGVFAFLEAGLVQTVAVAATAIVFVIAAGQD